MAELGRKGSCAAAGLDKREIASETKGAQEQSYNDFESTTSCREEAMGLKASRDMGHAHVAQLHEHGMGKV